MSELHVELPRLRPYARQGKAAEAELRAYLKQQKYAILRDVAITRQRSQHHGLTPENICWIALKYEINLKAMFEFLEDERILPGGTYDRVLAGAFRPMAALKQVWTEMIARGEVDPIGDGQ